MPKENPQKQPAFGPGRLPQRAWPRQRGIRYKSCSCWQLGSSPVLVAPCGAGRVGPGGPHGASSLPRLRALGEGLVHSALGRE